MRNLLPTLCLCSGLPLANPSQRQRARKPVEASSPGHRADLGSKWRITSTQILSWKMSITSHFTAGQTEARRHKEMKELAHGHRE